MRQTVKHTMSALAPDAGEPCPGQIPATFLAPTSSGDVTRAQLQSDHMRLTLGQEGLVRIVHLSDYLGLVIGVASFEDGEVATVTLRHDDPDLSVVLHKASAEHEISDLMRAWSIWADCLCLDRYVDMGEGNLQAVPNDRRAVLRRSLRSAPRRANRHFRTRRPCMMTGLPTMPRITGPEITARS